MYTYKALVGGEQKTLAAAPSVVILLKSAARWWGEAILAQDVPLALPSAPHLLSLKASCTGQIFLQHHRINSPVK
jgi:hypothetical protein